ncbi:MAG: 5-formyltetrahydrofolate cyclo-ligase [Cyanobacteria bacterium]|nr:5-formyltetrahydrofolate cyclo-ligase [Cyanobacteriota bacterium]
MNQPAMNSPATPAAEKSRLRRQFRTLRLAALAEAEAQILAVAQREIPILLPAGQRLGIYWPLAGEADLRPLAALDLPLALPAVWGEATPAARLIYRPWRPGEPLAPDHCGIPAPLASNAPTPPATELHPDALGLLLVPALALDRRGIRLGYGGGWYDRLRAEPAWRAVPALAVLPAACVVEDLPCDGWDLPFSGWLDERGLHRIATANIASL